MGEFRGCRRAASDDSGFTLIELVIALSVVLAVVASMIFVFVGALKSVSQAKQRQTATALANQTLERLRALPYDTIKIGVNKSTAAFAADPDIADKATTPRLAPTRFASVNETLLASTSQTDPLLGNHRVVTRIDGVGYTVGVYVTQAVTPQPAFNLTALVTYQSAVSQGVKTTMERTTAFSPSGCLSTATHPFAGPCQASFSARAGVTSGGITVTDPTDAAAPIVGFGGSAIGLELSELATSTDIEQTTTLTAGAKTTTATQTVGTTISTSGGQRALTAADSDPSSSATAASDSKTAAAQTSSAQTMSGLAGTLVATPTSADTANAASQVVAGASGCVATDGTAIASGQPCSSGDVRPQGITGQVTVELAGDLAAAGRHLPPMLLGSVVAAPAATRAMAGRFTTTTGAACTISAPPNCAHASVSRSLGTVTVGSVPARTGSDTGPAAYDYAFSVTGLVESARAESGTGARAPTMSRSAGSLRFWNGSMYITVALTTIVTDQMYDPPASTFTYKTLGHSGVAITVDPVIRVSAPRTAEPLVPPACNPQACTQVATSSSTVTAEVSYLVVIDGVETTRFVVKTNLGSVNAQTSYRAAPLA